LHSKTEYTFVALPFLKMEGLARGTRASGWNIYSYPFNTLPRLECHIAPPFAVIKAWRNCTQPDLDEITKEFCELEESRPELKCQLELLREIWVILVSAKGDAKEWECQMRLKSRREQDGVVFDRFSQSTSQRTTRLKSNPSQGPAPALEGG
jgi:hypothetical protein